HHYVHTFPLHHTRATPTSTLSLHDALPISFTRRRSDNKPTRCSRATAVKASQRNLLLPQLGCSATRMTETCSGWIDCITGRRRRSEEHTSELRHQIISYAVFCLKKKMYI